MLESQEYQSISFLTTVNCPNGQMSGQVKVGDVLEVKMVHFSAGVSIVVMLGNEILGAIQKFNGIFRQCLSCGVSYQATVRDLYSESVSVYLEPDQRTTP